MEIRQAQREGPGGYAIPYAAAGVMVGVEVIMYVYINNKKQKRCGANKEWRTIYKNTLATVAKQ